MNRQETFLFKYRLSKRRITLYKVNSETSGTTNGGLKNLYCSQSVCKWPTASNLVHFDDIPGSIDPGVRMRELNI